MKKIILIFLAIISLLISSCKTGESTFSLGKIEKRRYMSGFSFHVKKHQAKGEIENSQISNEIVQNRKVQPAKTIETNTGFDIKISSEIFEEISSETIALKPVIQIYNSNNKEIKSTAKTSKNQIITQKKKEKDNVIIRKTSRILIKKNVSTERSNISLSSDQILGIILSIIFPPLGVLIYTGFDVKKTLIALILTLLFWVPGLVYALLVIFDKI